LVHENIDESGDRRGVTERRTFQVEAHVESNLVVSGPTGVQLPGEIPDQFRQSPFDGAVNIFVSLGEHEGSIGRLGSDLVETSNHVSGLI
jgi:hypothetical protein